PQNDTHQNQWLHVCNVPRGERPNPDPALPATSQDQRRLFCRWAAVQLIRRYIRIKVCCGRDSWPPWGKRGNLSGDGVAGTGRGPGRLSLARPGLLRRPDRPQRTPDQRRDQHLHRPGHRAVHGTGRHQRRRRADRQPGTGTERRVSGRCRPGWRADDQTATDHPFGRDPAGRQSALPGHQGCGAVGTDHLGRSHKVPAPCLVRAFPSNGRLVGPVSKPAVMRRMQEIAHVDVNCFYASAGRLFKPALEGRPVILLSNNDGCAVTRPPEAKRLGIGIGDPWFKLRPRAKEWGLVALSSNYELYGDISARVMELLGRYSAWLEVYSIDEAFLGVKGKPDELLQLGRTMKEAVRRNVGVPVCVGIANTKTLPKLANKWAKNNPAFGGVCHWDSIPAPVREDLMGRLSVEEVWGIAGRLTRRLNVLGIFTIADLAGADPVMIRDRFNVVVMR